MHTTLPAAAYYVFHVNYCLLKHCSVLHCHVQALFDVVKNPATAG